MKKLSLLLALAVSALAMVSMQAVGSRTPPDIVTARGMRICKALVEKMDLSPSANTWRNRVRTWQCRDDLSPDGPAVAALVREQGR